MPIWNTDWYILAWETLSRFELILGWFVYRFSIHWYYREKWRMPSLCTNRPLLLRKEKNIHKHCRCCLLSILDLFIWYVLNIFFNANTLLCLCSYLKLLLFLHAFLFLFRRKVFSSLKLLMCLLVNKLNLSYLFLKLRFLCN